MGQLLESHSAFEEDWSPVPSVHIGCSYCSVTPVAAGGSDASELLRHLFTCTYLNTRTHTSAHTHTQRSRERIKLFLFLFCFLNQVWALVGIFVCFGLCLLRQGLGIYPRLVAQT